MQQHGRNILPADPLPPSDPVDGFKKVKIQLFQLFQNMVLLHIKLKRITVDVVQELTPRPINRDDTDEQA